MQKLIFSNLDNEEWKISDTPQFWNSLEVKDSDFSKSFVVAKNPLDSSNIFTRLSLTEVKRRSSVDAFDDSDKYVNKIK